MRIWAALPLIFLGLLVTVAAFVLLSGKPRETVSDGRLDRPAPTFALTRLEGEALLNSDQLRGRAHVINIFASWCTPCRAEHGVLVAMKNEGAEIIGIAFKDEPGNTRGFLTELGDPFSAVAMDPDGRYALELGAAGVPETFVIGADGRIKYVHRGPLTPELMRDEVMPALRGD